MPPNEWCLAEQAVLTFWTLDMAGQAAADGTVLRVCEKLAIEQGRELPRKMLEAALHEQAEQFEKLSLSTSAPNKGRELLSNVVA